MPDIRRCMCCMQAVKQDSTVCPNCGESLDVSQPLPYLPMGTVIAKRYVIGKVINVYGDGVTYIGFDKAHSVTVDIHEFLPISIIKRSSADMSIRVKVDAQEVYYEYLKSFAMLWRALMRMPLDCAIPTVTDIVVNENFTAYSVTKHMEGVSLETYLAHQPSHHLSWERIKELLIPVCDTMEQLNNLNIIHRSLSPKSLMVVNDEKIYVTGFCIPQLTNAESQPISYINMEFAPIEQFGYEYQQGSWTDVYSYTAVVYHALSGLIPPKSISRIKNDQLMIQQDLVKFLPESVIKALFSGLRIYPKDRLHSFTSLKALFLEDDFKHQALLNTSPTVSQNQPSPISNLTDSEPFFNELLSNDPDDENAKPKKKKNQKVHSSDKSKGKKHPLALVVSMCVSLVAFSVLFIGLYPTVLYPYFEFNAFNSIYEQLSFLPINQTKTTEPTLPLPELTSTTPQAHAEDIKVIDFKNMKYTDIKKNETINSRYLITYDFVNQGTVAGAVVNQSIDAGETIAYGSEIVLTVGVGSDKVLLPSEIVGMDFTKAKQLLESFGFLVTENKVENTKNMPVGTVVSSEPICDVEYDYGTGIILNVCDTPFQIGNS